MSLSSTWQNLVASALLGTERQKPNVSELDVLRGIDSSKPEAALLSASATLSLYKKAGFQLSNSLETTLEKAEPETQPQVSGLQQSLLLECLHDRVYQLEECLQIAAKIGVRAPFELLDKLIHEANSDSSLREYTLPVLGVRGIWLAKHLDYGAWVAGSSLDESVWELGLPAQRRDYLSALRNSDPKLALQKLELVWAQEPAKIRNDLIATLEVNLSINDEEFIEKALEDKGKDVRETAAKLLTQLPNSRLMERMKARITALLQFTPEGKAGMLGLKKGKPAKLEVRLPETCDKAMQRDGISPKPPTWDKIGEKAFWFKQMLEIVPLWVWEQTFGATPTQIVAATDKNDYQKLMLEAWRTSLTTYSYNLEWARALMEHKHSGVGLGDYADLLSDSEFDEFCLKRLKDQPKIETTDSGFHFAPTHRTWTAEFSTAICEYLKIYFETRDKLNPSELQKYNQAENAVLDHFEECSTVMNAEAALEVLEGMKLQNAFSRLDATLEVLRFRLKLQQAFKGEQP